MSIKLDDEQAILESVEQGEWRSKGNISSRIIELQAYLKQEKKGSVGMLIHQYTSNKIHLDI